jgi:hypothetical protein
MDQNNKNNKQVRNCIHNVTILVHFLLFVKQSWKYNNCGKKFIRHKELDSFDSATSVQNIFYTDQYYYII